MSKFFGNLEQDFLGKLDKLNFVKYDFKRKSLHTADGIEVTCKADMDDNGFKGMPVQIVMYVWKDGVKLAHWGSMSNDENVTMVNWFASTKTIAQRAEREAEKIAETMAEKFWESL